MDIARIAENKYRIKVKRGVAVVNVGLDVEIQGTVSKTPFVITQPGEYEVEGISVFAYQTGESLASVIHVEDLKVLAAVIVNTDKMNSKASVAMIGKIEPSCVVPAGDATNIAVFVKDFEHASRETNKLSLSKATLNSDITDVVVLTD